MKYLVEMLNRNKEKEIISRFQNVEEIILNYRPYMKNGNYRSFIEIIIDNKILYQSSYFELDSDDINAKMIEERDNLEKYLSKLVPGLKRTYKICQYKNFKN